LKQSQLEEIASLENQIIEVRREQTKIINDLKAQFLKEKADYKKEADDRIANIVQIANKEAKECLNENTLKIKLENQKLRSELFELIKETKELTEHKGKLDEQKKNLLDQIRYAEDLKKIRTTQNNEILEKLAQTKN
jgi:hypothetical protein